jgi:GH15 family glucan-1,4-alpha-glucosidase
MSRTLDALRAELGTGPYLHRYSGGDGKEGAFLACSLRMISALALCGRRDEA